MVLIRSRFDVALGRPGRKAPLPAHLTPAAFRRACKCKSPKEKRMLTAKFLEEGVRYW